MIERMPQATAYVPRRFLVQGIITGIFVIRGSIMRSLYQHGLLSPVAGCTAGRVVGTPVIHIIAPFTCEVSDFRVTLRHFHRMTELNREILRPFGLRITARITRRIRILFINKTFHMSGKILRIPCFVQNRFQQPYTRMVTVTANQITNIIINPFGKNWFIIPELPSGSIHYNKQA